MYDILYTVNYLPGYKKEKKIFVRKRNLWLFWMLLFRKSSSPSSSGQSFLSYWYNIFCVCPGSLFIVRFILAGSEAELNDIDSLDGGLPSSSSNRNSHHQNIHHNSSTPSSLPPVPEQVTTPNKDLLDRPPSFTKGPSAKNKKHRKLNKETTVSTQLIVCLKNINKINHFAVPRIIRRNRTTTAASTATNSTASTSRTINNAVQ